MRSWSKSIHSRSGLKRTRHRDTDGWSVREAKFLYAPHIHMRPDKRLRKKLLRPCRGARITGGTDNDQGPLGRPLKARTQVSASGTTPLRFICRRLVASVTRSCFPDVSWHSVNGRRRRLITHQWTMRRASNHVINWFSAAISLRIRLRSGPDSPNTRASIRRFWRFSGEAAGKTKGFASIV